ncbi:FecR domain-containing protein [Thauera linaloolentis]|uniref:Putative transmembrane sensor n=1 Tax=Thauera linaloolentis (strain DSM 12138 / JCM 21573 / CCUG 41526 / CIP 105981 / IAM 15112 / NBRC 102519 / 47Lol) TaxID=1123367 RepID=N6Z2A9_THAL4|nr:FecR domain-containing protein [Thauera linaloolentis]ENO88747.1 putative transmembrane sensor [Thauera linaloolentis 47Lol = DSM 12138]MCM8564944.1 FecR domain-containing protein [Thauera linaloolentis]
MNAAAEDATPRIPPHVAEAAMEWWVELQSDPVTDDMRAACLRWRGARPEHEQAWQIIAAGHSRLHASALPPALAHAALGAPRGKPARRRAIKALAVLVFAGGGAWGIHRRDIASQWFADYRTGTGERRDIVLADGTRVTLDTDTALDIRFGEHERRLHLRSGRIHIDTAPDGDSRRPFFVDTAQGRAQALGTRFTVRQDDGASHIAVYEGSVALIPRHGGGLTLGPSEQTRLHPHGTDAPRPTDDRDTAWRQGMLIVSAMRLDDFIAELGRYRSGWLHCDPQVAALRVSGSFPLADTDRALDALANTLPVDIVRRTRYWAAVRPRAAPG